MVDTEQAGQQSFSGETLEGPGKRLREVRESSNLSLEAVAHQLNLDVRLIIALEENDYEHFSSSAFAQGYLRSYARLLNLPEDEVLTTYNDKHQQEPAIIPKSFDYSSKAVKPAITIPYKFIFMVFAMGLIIVILWVIHDVSSFNVEVQIQRNRPGSEVVVEKSKKAPPKEQTQNLAAKVESAHKVDVKRERAQDKVAVEVAKPKKVNKDVAVKQAKVDTKGQLVIHYLADSWTDIRDVNGKPLIEQMVEQGNTLMLNGSPPFTLSLEHPLNVKVTYNGESVELINQDNKGRFVVGD